VSAKPGPLTSDSAFGITGMQPAARTKPLNEDPFDLTIEPGPLTWSAYPINHPPIPVNQRFAFNRFYELSSLGAEVQNLVYGGSFPKLDLQTRFDQAEAMHSRFQAWHDTLPREYQYQQPQYIVSAPTVDLTFSYFHFLHHCYQWILTPDLHLSPTTNTDRIETKVRDLLLSIIFAERDLIRRFKIQFGRTAWSLLMPQPLNVSLHILFNYLSTDPSLHALFLELFRTLVESADRWRITQGLMRVIIGTAEAKGDDAVPKALREEMARIAEGVWKPRDHLHFSSQYPNYALAREKLETVEMSDLLEKWAEMSLGPEEFVDEGSGNGGKDESVDRGRGRETEKGKGKGKAVN
jgi:hypothetical protein